MRRVWWLTVVSLLLPVTAMGQPPQSKETKPAASVGTSARVVEAKIRQSWQDFKDKKKDAYGAILTDDHTAAWADGKLHDKQAATRGVEEWTLNSFALSDFKVTPLGASAALATYKSKVDGSTAGQKVSGTLAVTEVWVKRGNDWKCLRYHESELK